MAISIQQSRRAESRTSFLAQTVTKAADGFDNVSGLAELFAQTAHVSIDRARVDHTFVAPNFVQKAVALLDAAAPLHQRSQKFELETGEIDPLPVYQNFVARWIDRDRSG